MATAPVLLSLFLFYLLFLGRSVLLYRRGIKVWVIGTSSRTILEIILENILFPFLIAWSVFVVLTALNLPLPALFSKLLLKIDWLQYVGLVLCYLGLAIFGWALISFGKAWRIGIDEKNSNELITTGAFRFSRNPIFLFMDLYFIGMMLIYPNVILIVSAIAAVIGIHLQILREERFLLNRFGNSYVSYRSRTRRYF